MKYLFLGFSLIITLTLHAQQTVVQIYKGAVPGSENWKQSEAEFYFPTEKVKMVRNVTVPTLTEYLPEKSKTTGTAIVIAPGGGFRFLSWEKEGTKVAEWLQGHGVAAFVLRYRINYMGNSVDEFLKYQKSPQPPLANDGGYSATPDSVIRQMAFDDGRQAIKYLRQNAAKYGINPERIGMMGFSAGGMVTMDVTFNHTPESRPDFVGNIYGPVKNGIKAPTDAPPLFYAGATDDAFLLGNAADLFKAWQTTGNDVEFHVYATGGHGFGMDKSRLPVNSWIDRFGDWLSQQGLLSHEPAVKAPPLSGSFFLGKWNATIQGTPQGDLKMNLLLERRNDKLGGVVFTKEGSEPTKIKKVEEKEKSITVYFLYNGFDVNLSMEKKDNDLVIGKLVNIFDAKIERVKDLDVKK
jgi:acetyl esterase/lipase